MMIRLILVVATAVAILIPAAVSSAYVALI